MLYGNKKLYSDTCAVKRGLKKLSPCLEAFRVRISGPLGIHIVNVVYDTIELGPAKGRPRLNVIVESREDYNRLCEEPFTIRSDVKEMILREFSQAVSESGASNTYNTNNVLLISDNFSKEAMTQAAQQLIRYDRKTLVQVLRSDRVWIIEGISEVLVVFFIDEEAKKRALTSGAGERIRQACFQVIKRYDEFDYITLENFTVLFDSRENLDKTYGGNLFYYFR